MEISLHSHSSKVMVGLFSAIKNGHALPLFQEQLLFKQCYLSVLSLSTALCRTALVQTLQGKQWLTLSKVGKITMQLQRFDFRQLSMTSPGGNTEQSGLNLYEKKNWREQTCQQKMSSSLCFDSREPLSLSRDFALLSVIHTTVLLLTGMTDCLTAQRRNFKTAFCPEL